MNLDKQVRVVIALFLISFVVLLLGILVPIKNGNSIIWSLSHEVMKKRLNESTGSIVILDSQKPMAVPVGRMVFIAAKNIDDNSIILLNNRKLPTADYTIANNEGLYLKSTKEGVFNIRVANASGVSNKVMFEVNNNYNIHLLYPITLISRYKDIFLVSEGLAIKLSAEGQAIDKNGFLSKTSAYAAVQVMATSKNTGVTEVIGLASKNPDQVVKGLIVDANSTAEYLISNRLKNLGELDLSKKLSESEIRAVASVAETIKNYTYENKDMSLKSKDLDDDINSAVRNIRKSRK